MCFIVRETSIENNNCLFHAFFYGLFSIPITLSPKKLDFLQAIAERTLEIELPTPTSLRHLLEILAERHPGWRRLEIKMGKVLRELVIKIFDDHEPEIKEDLYPAIPAAFQEYVKQQEARNALKTDIDKREKTFTDLQAFQNQFQAIHLSILDGSLSPDEINTTLQTWWHTEGFKQFLRNMKHYKTDEDRSHNTLAGDLELRWLGDFFEINIISVQQNQEHIIYQIDNPTTPTFYLRYNPNISHWDYLYLKDSLLPSALSVTEKTLTGSFDQIHRNQYDIDYRTITKRLTAFFQITDKPYSRICSDKACLMAFDLFDALRNYSLIDFTTLDWLQAQFRSLWKRLKQVSLQNTTYFTCLTIGGYIFNEKDDDYKHTLLTAFNQIDSIDSEEFQSLRKHLKRLPITPRTRHLFSGFYRTALNQIVNHKPQCLIEYIRTIHRETHLESRIQRELNYNALYEFAIFLQKENQTLPKESQLHLLTSMGIHITYLELRNQFDQTIFRYLVRAHYLQAISHITPPNSALNIISHILKTQSAPHSLYIYSALTDLAFPPAYEATHTNTTPAQKTRALIYLCFSSNLTKEETQTMWQHAQSLVPPSQFQSYLSDMTYDMLGQLEQKKLLQKKKKPACLSCFGFLTRPKTTRYQVTPFADENILTFEAHRYKWTISFPEKLEQTLNPRSDRSLALI